MKSSLYIFGGLIVVFVICFYCLIQRGEVGEMKKEVLEVHCAAGLRLPVEEIASLYEDEYGVEIQLNYGGSGQLYGNLKIRGGDLYIPADSSYVDIGLEEGVISESMNVGYLVAGIAVAEGNPKGIRSLDDLLTREMRVAIADRSAAVGKFTHEVLEELGLLSRLESGELSKFPTVNEVGMQVRLGAVDAGVIWDVLVSQYEGVEFVSVPEFVERPKIASVGIVCGSEKQELAMKFASYLTSKSEGGAVFRKYGFKLPEENLEQGNRLKN